jgi:hypothetical protein
MPRTLDSSIQTEITQLVITPAYLFEAKFQNGTVYMTNASRDIVFNGNTFLAAGNALDFEGFEESLKFQTTTATVKLSGITDTIKALVLNQKYIGNELKIYLCFFDRTGAVISEPFIIFKGNMDSMEFTDDPDSGLAEIKIPVASLWARFEDKAGRLTNASQQRKLYPNDSIFDQVASLSDKVVEF